MKKGLRQNLINYFLSYMY